MARRLFRPTVRTALYILALSALLPAMGVILGYGWSEHRQDARLAAEQSFALAKAVAMQQTRLADSTRVLLATLARMPSVQSLTPEPLNSFFRELLRHNPAYKNFYLQTADSTVVASGLPFPEGIKLSDRRAFQQALASRDFSAGEYLMGRIALSPVFHLAYPVMSPDEAVTGVLVAAVRMEQFNELVSGVNHPENACISLLDYKGIRLHRHPQSPDAPLGEPASLSLSDPGDETASGPDELTWQGLDEHGEPRCFTRVRLRLHPGQPPYMTIIAGVPQRPFYELLTGGLGRSLALLMVVLLMSLAIAGALGRLILGQGVGQLAEAARDLSEGNLAARAGDIPGCLEIRQLGAAFDRMAMEIARREACQRQVETLLRNSLQEKVVLLQEVHHRVKNNLQVVTSLLSLQVDRSPAEAAGHLRDSLSRIRSMALVHERLYQSRSLESIDIAEYIRAHMTYLLALHDGDKRGIGFRLEGQGVHLSVNKAVPCGMIVNELATNAIKHAFPAGRRGLITITLAATGDTIELTFSDNGVGLPRGFCPDEGGTLGMQIVHGLVQQIGGTLEVLDQDGAAFRITFTEDRRPDQELAGSCDDEGLVAFQH